MCPFIGYDEFRLTTGTVQILRRSAYWWLNSGRGKTYERLACALNAIGERDLAREFHQDCKKAIFFLSRF